MSESKKLQTNLPALNEYLFGVLDIITNQDLEGDKLQDEIERAKAVTDVAETIIDNAALMLKAAMARNECVNINVPDRLIGDGKDNG